MTAPTIALSRALLAAATLGAAFLAPAAAALPVAPKAFCDHYGDAPMCSGTLTSCAQCHAGPPMLNDFGLAVAVELGSDPSYSATNFIDLLPSALDAVGPTDSDADGVSNLEEIMMGTFPGNPVSHWVSPEEPEGLDNPYYDVGDYDPAFALKRVSITYCGVSPSYDEMQALDGAADPRQVVHDKLDDCLQGDYWREEALHRLADKRIRPLKAVGVDGDIILADYGWDYRLFSYALTDGRDARDLLLADYHVDEGEQIVNGTIGRVPGSLLGTPIRVGSGQPLEPERRAGMITTQWFLVVNTMFSQMPRTTAAQAYRAYLGMDIAKGEGIMPIEGEPRDVDNKGVQNPTCAACHSTLDPLAYAFSSYNGIEIALFGNPTGQYEQNRTPWGGDGSLFGEPVGDLLEWAERAANSDPFKRNLAQMFFEQALGHGPTPDDMSAFDDLWKSLPANNYSVNAMLHQLVDTAAFGAP